MLAVALATATSAQPTPQIETQDQIDEREYQEREEERQIELTVAQDWSDFLQLLHVWAILDAHTFQYDPLRAHGPGPAGAKSTLAYGTPLRLDFTSTKSCPAMRASVITPDGRFQYVAADDVCAFAVDGRTRVASPVPGMPFRGGKFVRALTLDRSSRYLYTANQDSNDVSAYAVDRATGVLTAVPGSPFAAGSEPFAVTTDGSGRFLYVANNTARSVSAYRIDIDTGALTPVAGSPFAAPDRPWAIAADPTGKFLYVAGVGLQAYRIDAATGAIAPVGSPNATDNYIAKGIAVDPSGRFVYASWGAGSQSGVSSYSIGATGALTAAGTRQATGDNPLAVAVAVSGAYVYVANLLDSTVSGFRADPDNGALSPIAGSPFATGANPKGLTASGNLPPGVSTPAGVRFARPVGVGGGRPPYSFSIADGTLPTGLTLDPVTGLLSGTPAVAGESTFVVRVTDSAGAASTRTFAMRIEAAGTGVSAAVEYYNASLDHYFITHAAAEIAKLDAGTEIKGWTRTQQSIPVYVVAQSGASPVCRYYIPPGLGNSHFFGRGTVECDATGAKNPSFVLEDPAFMHMVLPSGGACPAGTISVYRVFSNRTDANHRYMIDKAIRDQMAAKGWLVEGDGPDSVVMCAPA
jgi:6-phosphogluconolactonase (cycloisomerase 2 family)